MENLNKYLIKQDKQMRAMLGGKSSKKRVKLTPSQRLYIWEHPKLYGRKCSICGQRITKMSDMELDHSHPHKSGGTKMNLAHKECNRMKGAKGLRHIQKRMGFKTAKRKSRSDKGKRKTRTNNPYGAIKMPKFKQPKFDWGI